MSKPKFHPGPWPVDQARNVLSPTENRFAPLRDPVVEANAHLISAAPELYAAMEPFEAFINAFDEKPLRGVDDRIYSLHGETHLTYSQMYAAREAMRKARGEK